MSAYTDKITAYINGELEGQELKDFKKQLKVDKNLASDLEQMRGIKAYVIDKEFRDFRERLLKTSAEYKAPAANNPRIEPPSVLPFKKWLVAASVLLLVGAVYLFYLLSYSTNTPEQTLAEYFPKVENPIRRGQEEADFLSQKNVAKASILLQEGKPKEARKWLHANLTFNEITIFSFSQTQFYIAGTYLAEDNLEECIAILNTISSDPDAHHSYKKKADLLLGTVQK